MAKFAVGEIAVYVGPNPNPDSESGQQSIMRGVRKGDEVEIVGLPGATFCEHCGRYRDISIRDRYSVLHPAMGDECRAVREIHLRKRPQRGIPDKVLRWFESPITEDATA